MSAHLEVINSVVRCEARSETVPPTTSSGSVSYVDFLKNWISERSKFVVPSDTHMKAACAVALILQFNSAI